MAEKKYIKFFETNTKEAYNNPSKVIKLLSKDEFPFFYTQFGKHNEDLDSIKDYFKFYYKNNQIASYISWRINEPNDMFDFETIHIENLEVGQSQKNKGYFKKMMNDFLGKFKNKKITLQANTDQLIETYKKYDFQLYGTQEQFGNFMINFEIE